MVCYKYETLVTTETHPMLMSATTETVIVSNLRAGDNLRLFIAKCKCVKACANCTMLAQLAWLVVLGAYNCNLFLKM